MSEVFRHPCDVVYKERKVCKLDPQERVVYCSSPNGCGYVDERSKTILVGVYRMVNGKIELSRTTRIGLNYWNALQYITCCIDPDKPGHEWMPIV